MIFEVDVAKMREEETWEFRIAGAIEEECASLGATVVAGVDFGMPSKGSAATHPSCVVSVLIRRSKQVMLGEASTQMTQVDPVWLCRHGPRREEE